MHLRRRTCCSGAPVTTPRRPLPPPPACLLLSLDALQEGRVALQHLETAGSSVSPKLSLAVGQHWRSSSGPCTGGCGAGSGAGRGGRPWSGGRAGTAAPRLQSPVALKLPPPLQGVAGTGQQLNSHILTCINERVESYYEILSNCDFAIIPLLITM